LQVEPQGAALGVLEAVLPDPALVVVPVLFELTEAWQATVVPPFDPAQLQFHGPEPLTGDAAPELQRPAVGADATVLPFAGPHWPFIAAAPTVKLPTFSVEVTGDLDWVYVTWTSSL
jgi:hypothetical protein